MKMLTIPLSILATFALSSPTLADLQVEFIEGVPKDRFVLTNIGDCALGKGQFEIDFTGSSAGLIFDVTSEGAGVEVFQPFEITSGAEYLKTQPTLTDGDQRAILGLSGLSVNESISFTIDVDDTKGTRPITVTDSEIGGTILSLSMDGMTYTSVMKTSAKVSLKTPNCDAQEITG